MKNRYRLVLVMGVGSLVMGSCRGGCNATDKGDQGAQEQVKPGDYEGDDPEECRDGADNDQDGYFDCQDNGCWDSPDCDSAGDADVDADADADVDADTDTDTTDPCTDPLCDITSIQITWDIFVDNWTDNPNPIDPDTSDTSVPAPAHGIFPLCDCTMQFVGDGIPVPGQVDPSTGRASFEGTWTRNDVPGVAGGGLFPPCTPTIDACSSGLEDAGIWWNKSTNTAYHSLIFDPLASPPEMLVDWFAHQTPDGFVVAKPPVANQRFWITDMYVDYDHTVPNETVVNFEIVEDCGPCFATWHQQVEFIIRR